MAFMLYLTQGWNFRMETMRPLCLFVCLYVSICVLEVYGIAKNEFVKELYLIGFKKNQVLI